MEEDSSNLAHSRNNITFNDRNAGLGKDRAKTA